MKRNSSVDLLRIIACFFVISTHVCADCKYSLPEGSVPWLAAMGFTFLGKGAPMLFFLLSGAFNHDRAIKTGLKKGIYYLAVFFVSALFYSLIDALREGSLSLSSLLYGIYNFKYHLWFLTAFAGVCFAAPLLNSLGEREESFALGVLMFFCVLLPGTAALFPGIETLGQLAELMQGAVPAGCVYAGYYLLGRHLSKLSFSKRTRALASFAFAAVFAAALLLEKQGRELSGNSSIFILLQSVFAYMVFKGEKPGEKSSRLLELTVPCVFGIYVVHVFFVELLSELGFGSLSLGEGYALILCIILKSALVFLLSLVVSIPLKNVRRLIA